MGSNEEESHQTKLEVVVKIGVDERTAKNTLADAKVTAALTAVIQEAGVVDGCSKAVGNLIYMVATKYPANAIVHHPSLLQYIVSLKIKNPTQLEAASAFLLSVGSEKYLSSDFEEACGVVGNLGGQVRKKQPWADAKIVKQVIYEKLHGLLGDRTAVDDEKLSKKKKEKPAKVEDEASAEDSSVEQNSEEDMNPFIIGCYQIVGRSWLTYPDYWLF